jgi:hypothetical protein
MLQAALDSSGVLVDVCRSCANSKDFFTVVILQLTHTHKHTNARLCTY